MQEDSYRIEVDDVEGTSRVVTETYRRYHFPLHWHTFCELIVIKQGRVLVTTQNEKFVLNEGDIIYFPPGKLHAFDTIEDNSYLETRIQFSPMIVMKNDAAPSPVLRISNVLLLHHKETRAAEVHKIIDLVEMESHHEDSVHSTALDTALTLLYLQLIRSVESTATKKKNNPAIYTPILPVLGHIEKHYTEDLTTKRMAEIALLTEPYFCNVFKEATGCSFHIYLQKYRVNEAIKLLISTKYNISEICEQVGYFDDNYFIRVFKKHTGVTPHQYRKMQIE
jgi:YesN/AraC family two-component response regulator